VLGGVAVHGGSKIVEELQSARGSLGFEELVLGGVAEHGGNCKIGRK
jgi:hypothetical protein